ncbi:tetratricopeptide repeat protein [Streptomyces virginiae]|uniref:tetratricopeptide repeat protein n=1 Tax=Streptomyces virginiae TaxID=1961 RepID=UPI00052475DE|nr:tetratricopeptide repeat protein [Streptomyces virginiae]
MGAFATSLTSRNHAGIWDPWAFLGRYDSYVRTDNLGFVVEFLASAARWRQRSDTATLRDDRGRFLGEVAYLRGRALEQLGRAEEALKHFQTAFRYSPGLGDVAQRAKALTAPAAPVPVQAAPGRGATGRELLRRHLE